MADSHQLSDYDKPFHQKYGVKSLYELISRQLTMQGFMVGTDMFGPTFEEDHQAKMQRWLRDGTVKAKFNLVKGMEEADKAVVGMLKGDYTGKVVLDLRDG
jgi:NADPH-dependent curcumin reductase CurA